jgi:hypothetical protein
MIAFQQFFTGRHAERNALICEAHAGRWSAAALAKAFDLTVGRVYQIVAQGERAAFLRRQEQRAQRARAERAAGADAVMVKPACTRFRWTELDAPGCRPGDVT